MQGIFDPSAGNLIASPEANLIQEGPGLASAGHLRMPNHFYTEPGCAACTHAKNFLISRGIPFEERDVHSNPDYLRILTEELDSRTTPTLVLADKIIVGFDQAEYKRLAVIAGRKRKRKAVRGRA